MLKKKKNSYRLCYWLRPLTYCQTATAGKDCMMGYPACVNKQQSGLSHELWAAERERSPPQKKLAGASRGAEIARERHRLRDPFMPELSCETRGRWGVGSLTAPDSSAWEHGRRDLWIRTLNEDRVSGSTECLWRPWLLRSVTGCLLIYQPEPDSASKQRWSFSFSEGLATCCKMNCWNLVALQA